MVRYSYDVDGLTLPVRHGGHPALDFANTAAGWNEPERKEYLGSYAHLAVWAREAGLVGADAAERLRGAPGGDAVLARALTFREELYAVLLEPAPGPEWDTVAAEVEGAAGAARLRPGGWELPETVELPLLAVARAAGALLADPAERRLVRACPGTGCGWLFLDRRGRRRWCDMAVCGNRAKARRHAARAHAVRRR